MKLSRWTILAPVPGRDTTLVIQPLSGEAILLGAAEASALQGGPMRSLPAGLDEEVLRQARILVDSDEDDHRMLVDAKASFAAEMERTRRELTPETGETMQQILEEVATTPVETLAKLNSYIKRN